MSPARRRRLFALAAAPIAALLLIAPSAQSRVDTSGAAARISDSELWPVALSARAAARIGVARLKSFRAHGVNAIVVTNASALSSRRLVRARNRARKAHLKLLVAVTKPSFCRSAFGACAIRVHSPAAARKTASSAGISLAVATVRSPKSVKRYAGRAYAQRILVLPTLRARGKLATKAWRSAVLAASRNASLDLGVAPTTVKGRGFLAYLKLLHSVGRRDRQAPSAPGGLTSPGRTGSTLSLAWSASRDNRGVTRYILRRSGVKALQTKGRSGTVRGLACGKAYAMTVEARDAAGNVSRRTPLSAATSACGASGPPPPSGPGRLTPPAGPPKVFVSPSGNDSSCVRYAANPPASPAACKTFNRAYQLAQCGDLVQLGDGLYPAQSVGYDASKNSCSPSSRIWLVGKGNPHLNGTWGSGSGGGSLDFQGVKHVVLIGLTGIGPFGIDPDGSCSGAVAGRRSEDIVVQDSHVKAFRFIFAAKNIVVQYTTIGDYHYSESGAASNGVDGCDDQGVFSENILFDHVTWQNIVSDSPTHPECLIAESFNGLTIRNSRMINCPFGIETIPGTGIKSASNVLFENNFFTCISDCPWFWDIRAGGETTFSNWTIRFNTVLDGQFLFNDNTSNPGPNYKNFKVYGNIFDSTPNCISGADVTYAYNVFEGGTGPGGCTNTGNVSVGNAASLLVNPAASVADLHLKPGGSVADGRVPASYCAAVGCPGSDIDDTARPAGSALDAGADEH